jgi:hypothetical protein
MKLKPDDNKIRRSREVGGSRMRFAYPGYGLKATLKKSPTIAKIALS